jgi:hypothetical protein
MHPEQPANLRRVRSAIGDLVLRFAVSRLQLGAPEFRIGDLQEYVALHARVAPASPDRVLRQLRREGLLSYEVVSRRGSLYRLLSAKEGP